MRMKTCNFHWIRISRRSKIVSIKWKISLADCITWLHSVRRKRKTMRHSLQLKNKISKSTMHKNSSNYQNSPNKTRSHQCLILQQLIWLRRMYERIKQQQQQQQQHLNQQLFINHNIAYFIYLFRSPNQIFFVPIKASIAMPLLLSFPFYQIYSKVNYIDGNKGWLSQVDPLCYSREIPWKGGS